MRSVYTVCVLESNDVRRSHNDSENIAIGILKQKEPLQNAWHRFTDLHTMELNGTAAY